MSVQLLKNPYFLFGLILRMALLFYRPEGVFSDNFLPFMDSSINHLGENPWSLLPPAYFPYGIVLFGILFIFKYFFFLLFGSGALGLGMLSCFAMKLPLLLIDFLFLLALNQMTNRRTNHLLFFYWLNPVAIYISYIHGQLDIVPMFFAVLGIYFAAKKEIVFSSLLVAAGVLSKFNVLIICPLILAYFWMNDFVNRSAPKIFLWLGIFTAALAVGSLPLVFAERLGYISLGSPEAFRVFSFKYSFSEHAVIFFGVIVVMGIMARLILATRVSPEGLIYNCGLVLGSLLIVTQSMPGWYFWVLPFFALFFATYSFAPRILYALFIGFYFLAIPHFFSYSPPFDELFYGIGFSLLQLIVLAIIIFIYLIVIRKEAPLERRMRPLTIGIAGNSGSGKNTLALALEQVFGKSSTQIIEGDDYHKWERGNVKWQEYTHLHPRANHLTHLREHYQDLVHGKLIFQPHYDHETGQFTAPRPLNPTRTLIVQGLHTLYLRSLRNDYDLRIYISPNEDLRLAWKIKRDCGERGHLLADVLKSFRARESDTQLYVQPQKESADLVIEPYPLVGGLGAMGANNGVAGEPSEELRPEAVLTEGVPAFGLRFTVWNDSPIDDLLVELMSYPKLIVKIDDEKDLNRFSFSVAGEWTATASQAVADKIIDSPRSVTRSWYGPKWAEGLGGITQLLILKLLSGGKLSCNS